MTVLSFNDMLCKKPEVKNDKELYLCTKEDFVYFNSLLSITPIYQNAISVIDNVNEFYDMCPMIKAFIPSNKRVELFYAAKLGKFYSGIPTKITYILKKAIEAHDTINVALSAINRELFKTPYMNVELPDNLTWLDVINTLTGKSNQLLTSTIRKVTNGDDVEVYVENTDRVCVMTKDIGNEIRSIEDAKSIYYDEEKGVCLAGMPLRTIRGHYGIVRNDYDLREVI